MITQPETPQRRARRLMDELDIHKGRSFAFGDVKMILNQIACMRDPAESEATDDAPAAPDETTCRSPTAVTSIRRGDVFIAKLVGGKVRPWVVLHVRGDIVSALCFSTKPDSTPAIFASQCRFWPESYLCGTISTFDKATAMQEVTRPYTARGHLTEVERSLLALIANKKPRKAPVVALRSVSQ